MEISKKDYNLCKSSIRAAIRKSFSRSEHYKNFLKSKRVEWREPNGRKRVSYLCENCLILHPIGKINVDHKVSIGRGVFEAIEDTKLFYDLVYCDYSNLQILCRDRCHKEKTKKENKENSYHNALF